MSAPVRLLTVRHVTLYRYSKPVKLGEHRMMFRPRESYDLRLIQTTLNIVPRPTTCAGFTTSSTTQSQSRSSTTPPES